MKKENKNDLETFPLNVVGLEDSDIIPVQTKDGVKNVLDLKRIKLSKGAEFVELHDEKAGLIVIMQSFKEPILTISNIALSVFDLMKQKRGEKQTPSYT